MPEQAAWIPYKILNNFNFNKAKSAKYELNHTEAAEPVYLLADPASSMRIHVLYEEQ